ncbi:HesB/YadR/YfhF family protein [Oceanobacillus halotolerans]|uniref:HesB/YadR/YfhF family protein n=1 Tax=Oceanobacillus halotolerans TaxID=2663380 RepID=UPI0013DBF01B|nr:hypothetical protein [Oceanobacillus halotolerans]
MNLNVTNEAANWYKEEMGVEEGDLVRIFVKLYGGIPTVFSNFFLGVSVGKDGDMAIQEEVEGITFYINSEDSWLLDDHDLIVKVEDDEPSFVFEEV